MSTDWNVYCRTCKSTHRFDDANHQDEFMAKLIKYADAIASLAPLLATVPDVVLHTPWGEISASWFAQHRGHDLVPISEYGNTLTQCTEYVGCTCGTQRRCSLECGHDGPHGLATVS